MLVNGFKERLKIQFGDQMTSKEIEQINAMLPKRCKIIKHKLSAEERSGKLNLSFMN